MQPDQLVLARMPLCNAAVPRRPTVLHLREKGGGRIRAPHFTDVRKGQREPDEEDREESPGRCEQSGDKRCKRISVRDERDQYEWKEPRKTQPRSVGGPAEGRPPRCQSENESDADYISTRAGRTSSFRCDRDTNGSKHAADTKTLADSQ